MRAQYPSSSTNPRGFIKAHQVVAAMAAAILVTAAVAVSVGAWQLTDGSDESGRAAVRAPEFNFDRIEVTSASPSTEVATFDELLAMHEALTAPQFGTISPSGAAALSDIRIASFDEVVAMHEALTDAQFGAVSQPEAAAPTAGTDELLAIHEALMTAQADTWNDGSSGAGSSSRLPGEGGRGHVTIE